MKKILLLSFFLSACSTMKPVTTSKIAGPQKLLVSPSTLPASILKLHPKSFQLGTTSACNNVQNHCDGYMQATANQCFCVPMKCTLSATGKLETCLDLVPRSL